MTVLRTNLQVKPSQHIWTDQHHVLALPCLIVSRVYSIASSSTSLLHCMICTWPSRAAPSQLRHLLCDSFGQWQLSTLDMSVQAVNTQQKALVSSPIRSLVCRHAGPVHAISASLHHPALLISCGLDGQVRLCSGLSRQPLLELAPSNSYMFSVQWSPHRPMLFAVGAGETL